MQQRFNILFLPLILMSFLSSCFTGVESTKKITDKDVARLTSDKNGNELVNYISVHVDSFPNWKIGKRFYVADNNVNRIFLHSPEFDLDTLRLAGKELRYEGYKNESLMDNSPKVNIVFSYEGKRLVYPTNKTLDGISELNRSYEIPFLIDSDLIQAYRKALVGENLYVKTSLWLNEDLEPIKGRKFIKVSIADVCPGNEVYPLKIKFATDDKQTAFLLMATNESAIQNRSFDDLFSKNDVRLKYPSVSDENWALIQNGGVKLEMTKDECRLSLGSPRSIDERPSHDELREYWFYDNGAYLVFSDGILVKFRK